MPRRNNAKVILCHLARAKAFTTGNSMFARKQVIPFHFFTNSIPTNSEEKKFNKSPTKILLDFYEEKILRVLNINSLC